MKLQPQRLRWLDWLAVGHHLAGRRSCRRECAQRSADLDQLVVDAAQLAPAQRADRRCVRPGMQDLECESEAD